MAENPTYFVDFPNKVWLCRFLGASFFHSRAPLALGESRATPSVKGSGGQDCRGKVEGQGLVELWLMGCYISCSHMNDDCSHSGGRLRLPRLRLGSRRWQLVTGRGQSCSHPTLLTCSHLCYYFLALCLSSSLSLFSVSQVLEGKGRVQEENCWKWQLSAWAWAPGSRYLLIQLISQLIKLTWKEGGYCPLNNCALYRVFQHCFILLATQIFLCARI